MIVGFWTTDLVEVRQDVTRILGLPIEGNHLVEDTMESAFHRGPVIPDLPKDQRVVCLADRLQSVEDASDLEVGLRGEAGESLHQPGSDAFLIRREGLPRRDLVRPRG